MKNKFKILNLFLILFIFAQVSKADSIEKLTKKSQDAADVLESAMSSRDRAIPLSLLNKAVCVATVPNVVRIGFVYGVRFGKGLVSCRTGQGWSNPSFIQVKGGSWGVQFGLESVDLVMVFVNQNAIEKLSKADVTLGANAAVTAGPLGREAQIGTDYKLDSEIYSYSKSKGLFAGLTIQGSVLTADKEDNLAVYGDISANSLLVGDGRSSPEAVRAYSNALLRFAN